MEVGRQNYGHCKSCESDFIYQPEDTWFDENGYGYSTKLAKCPYCGKIVVIEHIEDYGFSKLNTDGRYF